MSEDNDAIPGRNRYDEAARAQRMAWWNARTGVDATPLAPGLLQAEPMRGHVENFVGAVSVPVGLAGPLRFVGEETIGTLVAPMATTEGALVAATSRGALAITRAGGVTARVLGRRMVRAPLFGFGDGAAATAFARWVRTVEPALADEARRGSQHTRLVEMQPYVIGRDVHAVLGFDTGDAAGQNMVTLATARICAWIRRALPSELASVLEVCTVEGQMGGDKNLSFFNASHGRGTRVSAECVVPRAILEQVLKVSPEALARAHHSGTAAALQSGVVGYNANAANVIAALFVATGQDIACVHESAFAILTLDAQPDRVYANLLLPSLVVGTVGGGTVLPAQQACLASLECAGSGKVGRFAEVVAGFALALELSSYAAMVSGDFATAHATLGRKSP
jgi:NADP-dependent 3-hydroxy-3-methylglutaryl-CoA reductase